MTKLISELRRLYFLPDQSLTAPGQANDSGPAAAPEPGDAPTDSQLELVSASGQVRALVLAITRSADWASVAALYGALQTDLELPAPALAVSGNQGFQLWFSLAEGVPRHQAAAFLTALGQRYLAELGERGYRSYPGPDGQRISLVPARQDATGLWSAFIDPTMGAMFTEDGGLAMAPNPQGQADLLAGLSSITPEELRRAQDRLGSAGPVTPAPASPRPEPAAGLGQLDIGTALFNNPVDFLLAVMNDSAAAPQLRVEAAKALLPYFPRLPPA